MDNEEVLDWGSTIEADPKDFELMPDGDYKFTVTMYEKNRSKGSDKVPPSPMAVVHLRFDLQDGTQREIKHYIVLNRKCEGMISSFFLATGQKKHDEPMHIDFDGAVGRSGWCKITHRAGQDGKTMFNSISKFYAYDEQPSTQTPAYQPGKF